MNKSEKAALVAELTKDFSAAHAAFFADYKGLTVEKVNDLRRHLRPLNVKVKVVKNNLARIAVKESKVGDGAVQVLDSVAGPTMIAFAFGDAAAAAKVIAKFADDNEVFTLKDGLLGAQRIAVEEVKALSKLPSRDALLAKMLGSMNAPITNFVGVLAAVPRSLVQVLGAIQHKKSEES